MLACSRSTFDSVEIWMRCDQASSTGRADQGDASQGCASAAVTVMRLLGSEFNICTSNGLFCEKQRIAPAQMIHKTALHAVSILGTSEPLLHFGKACRQKRKVHFSSSSDTVDHSDAPSQERLPRTQKQQQAQNQQAVSLTKQWLCFLPPAA